MAGSTVISLKYTAEIGDLRKKLASIPDITAAEARKAVSALNREIKKANKVQDGARKKLTQHAGAMGNLKKEAGETASVMGKWKSGLELLGPEVAGVADVVQKMADGIEGAAQVGAKSAAAMGVLGLAVAGVVAAFQLADAAVERANERIEQSAKTTTMIMTVYEALAAQKREASGEEITLTAKLNTASAERENTINAEVQALKDQIQEHDNFINQVPDVLVGLRGLNALWGALTGREASIAALNARLNSANKALRDNVDITAEATDGLEENADADAEGEKAVKVYTKAIEEGTATRHLATDAQKEATEALRLYNAEVAQAGRENDAWIKGAQKRLTANLDAQAKLHAIAGAAALTHATDEEKLTAAYEAELVVIDALAAQHGESTKVQEAALAARLESQKAYYLEVDALRAADQQAAVAAGADLAGAVSDTTDAISDILAAGSKTQSDGAKKAALVAFKVAKAAALVEILIRTNQAVMAALTVPPPAGPILAVANAVTGAGAAMVVASSSPPQFPIGMSGDHQIIGKQPGEAILTRSATTELGADTINRLNAGRGMDRGPSRSFVVLDHESFDPFFRRDLAMGGALAQAVFGDVSGLHATRSAS